MGSIKIKSHALQRKTNCCNCTDSKIERISSWGPVVHLSSQFVSVFSFQITLSKIKLIITLDQVYCEWLIKWVVKREIIQWTELCLTVLGLMWLRGSRRSQINLYDTLIWLSRDIIFEEKVVAIVWCFGGLCGTKQTQWSRPRERMGQGQQHYNLVKLTSGEK